MKPNTNPNPIQPTIPMNPGIADNVLPPVDYNEPVPQQQAEEKKTPTGEALSPDSRNKGTSARGTTERSKRGKLPKTGEVPIANPLPNLAALTLAAYALFAEEKRRREKAE